MKLQICAEIEGRFLLKEKVEAKLHPYEFSIYVKEDKFYISVTKPVTNYLEYAPQVYVKNGVQCIVATKPEIYKDMEEWLYYIEAMGAFIFEVSKIHIDELEVNWICENEEEQGHIPILSLTRNKVKRTAEKCLTNSTLSDLVFHRKHLPESYILFTYYRQAKSFFDVNNYYFAFINYFMMLEFCFADGKFKKNVMNQNFLKSKLLELCVLYAMHMIRNNDFGNYMWLYNECKIKQKEVDFEGVVHLLIEYRGLLSHASKRSKDFLHDDNKLRPLAYIISIICFLLCGYTQVLSCMNEESKDLYITERINELRRKNSSPNQKTIQNHTSCHD